ncbi:MAG: hypothetical protein RL490_123 [Pseudomonadota bacterium]|jgi:hypothetical protein
MIVVRVELWSAIDGSKRELARMHIANDGQASAVNSRRGDYTGTTFVGRDERALDRGTPSKRGTVTNYPRLDLHVWNLVARMLTSMGYDK